MIKHLLHPFSLYLIGVFIAAILLYLKRIKLAKLLFGFSILCVLISSCNFLPNLLVKSLEDRYPVIQSKLADSIPCHILVLGGGHIEDLRLPPNGQLHLTALGRLVEGIRLLRLLPNSKLILSGYSPGGRTTQAEMLQRTAILLGVNKTRISLQVTPKNTYEEAREYYKKHGTAIKLIVVTSASHMPRAIKIFESFGVYPIAAPTNFLIRGSGEGNWPTVKNMDNMHVAIKEYVAMWTTNWRN